MKTQQYLGPKHKIEVVSVQAHTFLNPICLRRHATLSFERLLSYALRLIKTDATRHADGERIDKYSTEEALGLQLIDRSAHVS